MRIHRSTWALGSYAVIVFAFRFGFERTSVGQALGARLPYAFSSFALLLAPLWLFGFGAGEWLRERLAFLPGRALCGGLFVLPYVIFSIRGGQLQWTVAILMAALPVALAGLLLSCRSANMSWQDVIVLATLVAVYMLHVLAGAWNSGLAALPKLYVADVTLYLYVVVRGLPGMGYSFLPRVSDLLIGFREWLFFLPFGIGLGFALGFIHLHARWPSSMTVGASLLVTFVLIAIPEEMFFRGVLQNLLETRFSAVAALGITAVLFGLSHFNKGAAFNWRYVLLASIAGIFYGRAWNSRHRILASVLTHTAVDVAWSLWFR